MTEDMTLDRRCFSGVDYVKFLMALCVVAIHVNSSTCVTGHWSDAIEWLIRLAVPFFFICSGFFLGRKLNGNIAIDAGQRIILGRAKKISRIFVCWLLIYLPITIYVDLNNGSTFMHDVVSYFGRLLLSGESEYAYPLWFLYSMAIVLAVYALLFKVKRAEVLLISVFAIITGVNALISNGVLGENFYAKWFSLLTARTLGGGLHIMSGVMLSRTGYLPKSAMALVLVALSVVLFVFSLPYWELCGGCALFVLALRFNKVLWSCGTLGWRSMSMWIYYLHMYVIFTLMLFLTRNGILLTPIVFMAIVSAGVIVLAGVLTRLQHVKGFRWLNYLVS